jgi:hypothetical protein
MWLGGVDVTAKGGEGHVPKRRLQQGQVVLRVGSGDHAAGLPLPHLSEYLLYAALLGPLVVPFLGEPVRIGAVRGLREDLSELN